MDLPNDEKNIEEFVDEHRSTQSMKSGSDSPQIKYTERKIRKRINSGNSGASGGKIVTKKYEVSFQRKFSTFFRYRLGDFSPQNVLETLDKERCVFL